MRYEIEVAESGGSQRSQAQKEVSVELAREWSVELSEMAYAHGISIFMLDMRAAKSASSIIDND
jgi:hypothetical protein